MKTNLSKTIFFGIPGSMIPRAQNKEISMKTILFFQMAIHELRAIQIFLVVIVTLMKDWHLRIRHIIQRRIFLPETVIIGMIHKIIPCWYTIVEKFFIHIF